MSYLGNAISRFYQYKISGLSAKQHERVKDSGLESEQSTINRNREQRELAELQEGGQL